MNSCVYKAILDHKREKPVQNSFSYSIYMFYFDLDELEKLNKNLIFFAYNKLWNIFSFLDKDHFKFINDYKDEAKIISEEKIKFDKEKYKGKKTRERIEIMIKELGLDFKLDKVYILTNTRIIGYVFNPVSFYYCFDEKRKLRALFSEVNNTFLEQKMYYSSIDDPDQEVFKEKQQKNYYISPFIDPDTMLHWTFKKPGEKLSMMIDSVKGDNAILKTKLTGRKKELNNICI